MQFYGLLKVSY